MVNNLFDLRWWLLSHLENIEPLSEIYKLSITVTFSIFLLLSLHPLTQGKQARKIPNISFSGLAYLVSLVSFVFAARWPAFLSPMLNPDEAQFTAGAMKLLKDPIFWRSLDAGSSGPLNVYPLTLPAFFGIRIEYASVRVIALIFIVSAVISLYGALNCLYGREVARLALIPIVTTIAFMTFFDYVHYSSEHLAIALLSFALFFVCWCFRAWPNTNRLIFFIGLLLGLIPYAKMQAVPIAFSVFCITLHIIWMKKLSKGQFFRSLAALLLGTTLPSAFLIFYLTIFSLYDEFWTSYIQQNLLIYGNRQPLSLFKKLVIFLNMSRQSKDTLVLFGLALSSVIAIISYFIIRKFISISPNKLKSNTFVFVFYGLAFLVASIYSVVKPGNGFTHYLLFLIVPSSFLIGVFLGETVSQLQISELNFKNLKFSLLSVAISIILACSVFQFATTLKAGNPYINNRKVFAENYTSPISQAILKYAHPGEFIGVWGWASELYVDTGLIQATRSGVMGPLPYSPLESYFFGQYAEDLLNSKARIFVDAVAPQMFGFHDRKTQGHEISPAVKKVVQDNYKLVEEVDGVRIYYRVS